MNWPQVVLRVVPGEIQALRHAVARAVGAGPGRRVQDGAGQLAPARRLAVEMSCPGPSRTGSGRPGPSFCISLHQNRTRDQPAPARSAASGARQASFRPKRVSRAPTARQASPGRHAAAAERDKRERDDEGEDEEASRCLEQRMSLAEGHEEAFLTASGMVGPDPGPPERYPSSGQATAREACRCQNENARGAPW